MFFRKQHVGGRDLEESRDVEFDIEDAENGPRAANGTRVRAFY